MADDSSKLNNARLRYDASGAPTGERVGSAVGRLRLVRTSDDSTAQDIDPALIADARRELWQRIPKFCRRRPEELLSRSKDQRLTNAARAWDWGSPCLVMCAPTDMAKTSVAASIPIRLMARGRESEYRKWKRIRWFGASDLMNFARAWSLGSGACPEVRAASTCDLLILDDLGNETDCQSTMFDILQHRYENDLDVIATTGLRPALLLARYGDAILRRLAQRNGEMGTIVDCWGDP